MKIESEKYVIASRTFPLEFDDGNGENVNDINEAFLYPLEGSAEAELECFDEPENYRVLRIKITYEI